MATAESLLGAELDGDSEFVVAAEGEAVHGYAIFKFVDAPNSPLIRPHRFCHLRALAVAPEARRRGIGSTLLFHVREICGNAGVDHIELDVWAFNAGARRFFEAAGFEVLATRMRLETPTRVQP